MKIYHLERQGKNGKWAPIKLYADSLSFSGNFLEFYEETEFGSRLCAIYSIFNTVVVSVEYDN